MAERPHFQELQYQLAAHIRDPEGNPPPTGIEDRRLKIYRELFFNNTRQLLKGTFPVLSRILGDEGWTALVRDYFANHISKTPLFLEVPKEFLIYLQEERGEREDDPPYLAELAHYEWVELALSVDASEMDPDGHDPDGDLMQGHPVISPLAWPLAYSFPVHRIGPDFQPDEPGSQPTFMLVYRDADDAVRFAEIDALAAGLLERIESDPEASGSEIIASLAEQIGRAGDEALMEAGHRILEGLRAEGVLLGTARRD